LIHIHIKFYSATQFLVIVSPLIISVAAGFALAAIDHAPAHAEVDPTWIAITVLTFLSIAWLFIGPAITNRSYETGKRRFLGIDISKNTNPSPAERLAMKLNLGASATLAIAVFAWSCAMNFRKPHFLMNIAFAAGVCVAIFGLTLLFLILIEMAATGFRFRPLKT
jgi:hypothetical protein